MSFSVFGGIFWGPLNLSLLEPAGMAGPAPRRRRLSPLAGLGTRGDVVSVRKSLGRNKLLPQGLAVYASPENRRMFEEEKKVGRAGGSAHPRLSLIHI